MNQSELIDDTGVRNALLDPGTTAVNSSAPEAVGEETPAPEIAAITEEEALRLPSDEPEPISSPLVSLSSADALARLRKGEVLRNVRIEDLRLRGTFDVPVRMERVHLVRPSLNRVRFQEDVEISHSTLDYPRFSGQSTFAKGFSLKGSTIKNGCIRGVSVAGTFRCDNLKTRGKFLIANAKFDGPVRFWDSRFEGWVELRETEFADNADFRSIHAEEGFVLTNCRFARDFLFRGATVCKKWEAAHTRFEGLLDLSKAKLNDYVYLETIEQSPGQQFAFRNTVAERLLIRTDQLRGRIASEIARDFPQAMAEYGFLKRVFEGLHRYEEEDWAFYNFKVNQRRSRFHSWRKPWTEVSRSADWLLLDRGCAYGTSPMRAVASALVLILAFALLYAIGINSLHVERVPFGAIDDKTSIPNRVMIGLTTSVASFISGYGDLRDAARGGFMNLLLIAESLLGTLLWGLFIVAFSRKVIR